jgi:hypothetical protein
MLETWTAQSSSRPSDPGGLALASISRRASSNQEADAAAADGGGGGGSGAASRGSMSVLRARCVLCTCGWERSGKQTSM